VPGTSLGNPRSIANVADVTSGDTSIFDSVGNGTRFESTTEDTTGCPCEQIIDAWGLGKGHTKFGCSLGIMRNWIDSVSP